MPKPSLSIWILVGMFLGIGFGLLFPNQVFMVAPLGSVFIKLLKMIVVPLIFISIVVGITRIGSTQKLSQIGLKTTVFYLATNLLAVMTSLFLVNWIKPGVGIQIFGHHSNYAPPVKDSLFNIVPDNLFDALVRGDSLQIIFAAVFFGCCMVSMNSQVKQLNELIHQANELLFKATHFVISLAPIGVFGLMANMVHMIDWDVFVGISKFALVIMLGLLIHGCLTLPIFFKLFSDRSLRIFVKNMQPALLSAFTTSSSSATLPITLECIEKNEQISPEIAGFVLPVGATVNMDGTAIYEAAACLFIAQAIGIELNFSQQIIVLFTAALAAIGAAAIPSAGLVTLTMVLSAVGLPLDGIAFLLAIDRPLDMSRTVVNVWGDMVGCAVVEGKNKKFKIN